MLTLVQQKLSRPNWIDKPTAQDPNLGSFVFVTRWSEQRGVDLAADIMPSLYVFRFSANLS